MNYRYTLVFDGGSIGNPGRSYGSFRLQRGRGAAQKVVRLEFGLGTNNEAEYRALQGGIRSLLEQLDEHSIPPLDVHLMVRGDSRLVLNQVSGKWKAKNPRMRALRDETTQLLDPFGRVSFEHQDRKRSFAILGH